MQTGIASTRKRTATPVRDGPAWATVNIVGMEHSQTPHLQCKNCGKAFSGGNTRIVEHILGIKNSVAPCKATTDEFLELKKKLQEKEAHKEDKRMKLSKAKQVMVVSDFSKGPPPAAGAHGKQISIQKAFNPAAKAELDEAIARLIYAENLPFMLTDSPHFQRLVSLALSTQVSGYKPPDRNRLSGDLLNSTTAQLRAESKPLRESLIRYGCTMLSDGWDDVSHNHLINCIIATAKGNFFEGTTMLDSKTHEDGDSIKEFLKKSIQKVGPQHVMHVCTDTCSVMKKAWRLLESELPWVTCSCCAAHVLSLELKDMVKQIDEVKTTVSKCVALARVLNPHSALPSYYYAPGWCSLSAYLHLYTGRWDAAYLSPILG